MLKKLFTYLLFGLTYANATFGMEKHNSDYLPVLEDFNKSPKSKHSLKTLLKNDTATPGIINRYGAATPVQSKRYTPVLKDFKKDSKAYSPDAYDNALEWPLNEPISLKKRAQNYLRDEVTASAMGKCAAQMAAMYLLQFSSTLVHEYGHALVAYYLQNGTAHIFMGTNDVSQQEKEAKLTANQNKFPRVSISSYNPGIGLTRSIYYIGQGFKNISYEPLSSLAGPLSGALFDLAAIKIIRASNLNSENYTNCFLSYGIGAPFSPCNALLLKALICKNPLESQAQACFIKNILNLIPTSINNDGYQLLLECGMQENNVMSAMKIAYPAVNMILGMMWGLEAGGKLSKFILKAKDPEFYRKQFTNADKQEISDLEAYFKGISPNNKFKKPQSEHTLIKIANIGK